MNIVFSRLCFTEFDIQHLHYTEKSTLF